MESSAGALRLPSGPVARAPERVDAVDRAAVDFLAKEVVPALSRAGEPKLVRAVRKAVDGERLTSLVRLPERQRRELLEVIEDRLARGRRPVDPRTIVRLTTVISAAPAQEEWLGHRIASPAR